MTELRLRADRAGLHDGAPWWLLDKTSRPLSSGHGVAGTPSAQSVLLIVPDDCVTVLTLRAPDLAEKRLRLALPTLLEEHLLVAPESIGFALLSSPAERPGAIAGMIDIAVYDKTWFDALLATPVVMRCPRLRVVAESWALPRTPDCWPLHLSAERLVLGLPNGAAYGDNLPSGGLTPQQGEQLLMHLRPPPPGGDAPMPIATAPTEIALYVSAEMPTQTPRWLSELLGRLPQSIRIHPAKALDWASADYEQAPELFARRVLTIARSTLRAATLPVAIAAGLLLLLEFGAVGLDWTRLTLERRGLQAAQQTIFRETMGPQAPLVNGPNQLLHKLDAVRTAAGQATPSDLRVLMTRLAEAGQPLPALDELRYEAGRLWVKPKTADGEAVWIELARTAGLNAIAEPNDPRTIRITP